MTPSETTRAKWEERIARWRESGQSGEAFARTQEFSSSSLYKWAQRLRGAEGSASQEGPQFVQVMRKAARSSPPPLELVVEVAGARIRVGAGFDVALLTQVVRALGGGES